METIITQSTRTAAQYIQQNELVAFPTETVYGLGANIFSESALKKIFIAKGRPSDNPLIVHIADLQQIELLAHNISEYARAFIAAFFPGALTLVLPKRKNISSIVSAGLPTIGIRMPHHPIAEKFLHECGVPIAAPSANLSGKPSPTTWQAVQYDLFGRISCILKGKQSRVGLESTVVDCTETTPLILRAGAITIDELRKIVPSIHFASKHAKANLKSPGTRYRHYSPRATIVIVDSLLDVKKENAGYIGLKEKSKTAAMQKICGSIEEYAHSLFAFFRACDQEGVSTIYCQRVDERGLGIAVMDRITRAATK